MLTQKGSEGCLSVFVSLSFEVYATSGAPSLDPLFVKLFGFGEGPFEVCSPPRLNEWAKARHVT